MSASYLQSSRRQPGAVTQNQNYHQEKIIDFVVTQKLDP